MPYPSNVSPLLVGQPLPYDLEADEGMGGDITSSLYGYRAHVIMPVPPPPIGYPSMPGRDYYLFSTIVGDPLSCS
jgi:hypothetical protein